MKDKETEVISCYHDCPFFGTEGSPSPIMCCKHPSLDCDTRLIITHDNSTGRVPDECPLRKGEYLWKIKLKTNEFTKNNQ